jgi:hypothetical protein
MRHQPDLSPLVTDLSPQLYNHFGGVGALATPTGPGPDTDGTLELTSLLRYIQVSYRSWSLCRLFLLRPIPLPHPSGKSQELAYLPSFFYPTMILILLTMQDRLRYHHQRSLLTLCMQT